MCYLFLGESLSPLDLACSGISFVAVLVIIRPSAVVLMGELQGFDAPLGSFDTNTIGNVLAFVATVFGAAAFVVIRHLGISVSANSAMFYHSWVTAAASLLLLLMRPAQSHMPSLINAEVVMCLFGVSISEFPRSPLALALQRTDLADTHRTGHRTLVMDYPQLSLFGWAAIYLQTRGKLQPAFDRKHTSWYST